MLYYFFTKKKKIRLSTCYTLEIPRGYYFIFSGTYAGKIEFS